MNDQNQIGKVPASKRRGRGYLLWLGASLASLLGLMLMGYIYEPMAEAADAKAYPPPGQLVDDVRDLKWQPQFAEAILTKGDSPSAVATILTNLLFLKGDENEQTHSQE